MLTTFDKTLKVGVLASYKSNGWLWLSQLMEEQYCVDCPVAKVDFDDETYILQVRPFNPGVHYSMQSGWIAMYRIWSGGAVLYIPELLKFAHQYKRFGQYVPSYDENTGSILINLNNKVKNYGR